jgi:ABC-type nickel/cobalt efflux system permease component RcnA
MARLAVLVVAIAALLAPALPAALANPFTGRPDVPAAAGGAPAQSRATAPAEAAWGPVAWVGRALLTFQREANRTIARHMAEIRAGETSAPLLLGIGLAFLYGVVHALGPGHGKLVVVSYFLSREARIGRGLLMGLQIALCHVISAMVVVALADLLLRRALGGPPAEAPGVRLASYGLIAAIGLVMTAEAVRRSYLRRKGVEVAAACCHGHAGRGHGGGERVRQGALSLGVGLVPCTGAVLILLYALANGMLLAGMLLVAAIAAGMAITMGALGVLSVVARHAVAARIERAGDAAAGTLAVAGDYAGALLITLIGATLLWSAW